MKGVVERYIDRVMAIADIRDDSRAHAIRAELQDHLHEKVRELESAGYAAPEALAKAVEDHGNAVRIGYSLREWRWLDVRLQGTARGVIAIGPRAIGVVAIGGLAMGGFACGGCAIGLVSIGGVALALLTAWGGLAVGALAYGGLAVGLFAFGGLAVGGIAAGGAALGLWVPGAGQVYGSYYTWQTAPLWMKALGEVVAFNPASVADREAFQRFTVALNLINLSMLAIPLTVMGILNARETKRVREIAGPTAE